MLGCNGSDCSRGGALPRGVKPRHVRCLNFGQSILELDAVEQCSVPNRVVVIDENVARIPCTEKGDYVRKWLETHENDERDPSQSSPVLGTSATTASERSPILSNSRKRPRGKICINRNATVKSLGNADCQGNTRYSADYMIQSKPYCRSKKKSEDEREHMSEIQCTPPGIQKETADEMSPVLGTHYAFKKRRRKLQYEPQDSVSLKYLKLYDYKITSTNIKSITESDSNCNNLRVIPMDHDKLQENLNIKAGTTIFSIEAKESPEKYQRCIETFSSPIQERLSFADSSSDNTDKNDSKIETGTSNDSKDEECNELSSTPSSNNNLSILIEDADTQEITKILSSTVDKSSIPSGQPVSRLAIDNLDETYYSEAEMLQNQSTHLSAMISEVPSLNKTTQKTGSKSTQTDAIISTITTPSRKSPDKNMYAHLLNSGKKRRRPKKGSIVAKLQSLVNAQISSIRIWRHRMNKEHDTTSARYISVLVRDSRKQFGNQFLEGIVIEDRFNLLQSDVQAEVHNAKAQPKEASYKNITIMLVCDIVGTLKMVSEVVINVYAPWNILDKDDLTLEAMYISISDNREIPDIKNTEKSRKRKKRIFKEFNCPCIEEQRELPFCARKPSGDKPDVMQQIFNF